MSWQSIALSIAAAIGLKAFYGMIRTDWPMAYMSVDSRVDPVTRRSMFRYLLFRFAPVFVVCLFVGVTVERWGNRASYNIVIVCSIYLISTSGWALYKTAPGYIGPKSLLFWLGAIPIVGLAGLLAFWSKNSLAGLVPKPSALVSDIWTAAFTATFTAAVLNALRAPDDTVFEQLKRTRDEIPRRYRAVIHSASETYNADPNLLYAVMFTENIQRPKWIRTIENTIGRFLKKEHTYGIMQAPSPKPISDEESIEIVASKYFAGSAPDIARHEDWNKNLAAIMYLARFNQNENFLDFAGEIYSGLQYGDVRPL